MSDSSRPHGLQPTRLLHPWDFPGKSTGVGCHCLLQSMKVNSKSEVAQSCPTLSDPMDCSLPGSSVHGIFQARVLEWGAIAFSAQINCLHTTPTKGWANHLSSPSGLTLDTALHSPHIRNQLSSLEQAREFQKNTYFCFID